MIFFGKLCGHVDVDDSNRRIYQSAYFRFKNIPLDHQSLLGANYFGTEKLKRKKKKRKKL